MKVWVACINSIIPEYRKCFRLPSEAFVKPVDAGHSAGAGGVTW
jgi:hypothetical protein